MSKEIEIETAMEIVRGAFAPLQCGVEKVFLAFRFKYSVNTAEGKEIVKYKLEESEACDPQKLQQHIEQMRRAIQREGYHLDHWSMPEE